MIAAGADSAGVGLSWRQRGVRALAIALGALMLCWPAFWNGYPLLFPDSLEYLGTGHGVTMMLRGLSAPAWMFSSTRSEIYAAGIFLLHGRGQLWPVIFMQAAAMAWAIWLTVRSLCRRPVKAYLAGMVLLSVLTGVAWNASCLMPDILGADLYLGLYLLVFARESLRPWERVAVGVLCWWAAVSHSSHLLLAALLGVLFALLWLLGWRAMRGRGRRLWVVAGVVVLAAGAQMLVHARLYGRASVFGNPRPLLLGRLLGDGPARLYLRTHCATLNWTLCAHVDSLPTTEVDFLWAPEGIWQTATEAERRSLSSEETPLLKATLSNYPLQQAERSGLNFVELLTTVGPWNFWNYGEFTPGNLEFAQAGLSVRFASTRQFRNDLPQGVFRALQRVTIGLCAVAVVALLPWLWRTGDARLLGLVATVLTVLPLNALLCGVVSCTDARLQDRLAWMLALLAGVMVCRWWSERGEVGVRREG